MNCEHCGQELMGAVNRCWKCGQPMRAATPPASDPARLDAGDPVAAAAPGETRAADEVSEAAAAAEGIAPRVVIAELAAELQAPRREEPPGPEAALIGKLSNVYVGSPFLPEETRPLAPPDYPQQAAAEGGAVASVMLGVMSLVFCAVLALGAVLTSLLGLALGVWGSYSRRRNWAVCGMILCCFALAIAGYVWAVEIYTFNTGVAPAGPQF